MQETEDSKFDVIQRPPKIFLDTNHLINIANMLKGQKPQPSQSQDFYRRIDECIKSFCGLIFNPYAALEWVERNATIERANEIAAVVDSARLKYVLEADYLVYTREVLDQCREQNPSINAPDLPPILQNISDNSTFLSSLGILATQVPDYLDENQRKRFQRKDLIPIEVPIFFVREWIEETLIWKDKNTETYQKRVDDFKTSLWEDIERKQEYFNDRQQYRKEWIRRFLKIDRILRTFNPGIDVDEILDKFEVKNCPAVNLYWTVREKRMRSGNPPEDNDVDDYMFLPVVPYADIVLTERNLRAFILQADKNLKLKVFSKASEALKVLEYQGFAW